MSGVLEDGTRSEIAEEGDDGKSPTTTPVGREYWADSAAVARNWAAKVLPLLQQLQNLPRNPFAKQALAIKLFDFARSRARPGAAFFKSAAGRWLRAAGRSDCPG